MFSIHNKINIKNSVLIFYCCLANYNRFSSLNQNTFIIPQFP